MDSNMAGADREKLVDNFCDPESDLEVFITTYRIGAQGENLHAFNLDNLTRRQLSIFKLLAALWSCSSRP